MSQSSGNVRLVPTPSEVLDMAGVDQSHLCRDCSSIGQAAVKASELLEEAAGYDTLARANEGSPFWHGANSRIAGTKRRQAARTIGTIREVAIACQCLPDEEEACRITDSDQSGGPSCRFLARQPSEQQKVTLKRLLHRDQ